MKKVLYTPVQGGLKDLSGAVKMEMEAGKEGGGGPGGGPGAGPGGGEGHGGRMGMMGNMDLTFNVVFKAPDDLKVEIKDMPGEAPEAGGPEHGGGMAGRIKEQMGKRMSGGISRMLKIMIEGFTPAGDAEYDADVKMDGATTKLVMTSYLKGVEVNQAEFTLDANGLPVSGAFTPKGADAAGGAGGPAGGRGARGGAGHGADGKNTINFSYSKEGEMFRLDKMTFDSQGQAVESQLKYADAGPFKVVYSWETPGPMGAKFAVRFSEILVNGKPVELPKPAAAAGGKPGAKGEMDEDDEKDEKDEKGEKHEGGK